MKKKYKYLFLLFLSIGVVFLTFLFLRDAHIPVFQSKGMIAHKERDLIVIGTLLMLIVVVPVFILTWYSCWKYRAGNEKAIYRPNWDNHWLAETIWWGLPFLIIAVLSVITWKACHDLDPFKPIESDKPSVKVQVVALDWKWLFLYPEEGIASVNFLQFPEQVPIDFDVTSDAPMNSFWIPQLGGQIYAMAGMRSKLYLIADEVGSYRGSSANLSGEGFAGMTFTAKASTQAEFDEWVQSVRATAKPLTLEEYERLAQPSQKEPVAFYTLEKEDLFDWILMQYMMPSHEGH